jgi:hypothetical protein
MIRGAACGSALALTLLASASAGASSGAPPSTALTASPAHVQLDGAERTTVHVTNPGRQRVVVDVSRAGFALDLRGRPQIVAVSRARRTAAPWLAVRPRTVTLAPHTSASLFVASRIPLHVEPGDHDALLLLTTRPRREGGVAARMRMGILVVVRAPGRVVHGLAVGAIRVARAGRARALELVVANRGNVTESFARSRAVISLERGGRRIARLVAERRELRPFTIGVFRFRYRASLTGAATARVELAPDSGRVLRESFRVRL